MEVVILSMAIFAFICTILNLIDLFKTRNKINEVVSKHNLLVKSLVCDLQKIEKEVENLKNQMIWKQ